MADKKYSNKNALPAGYNLGSFQIGHILGSGAFGITYFAKNQYTNKKYAIKELYPSSIASRNIDGTVSTNTDLEYEEAIFRFKLEAATLKKLNHPNLVKLHDHFYANGTSYIVMEYQSGYNLKHHIIAGHGGPNGGVKQFCDFFTPLLHSINYLHKIELLHRDIKPQNIFVAPKEQPILLDFGSSIHCPKLGIKPDEIQYSPRYAPPEQIKDGTLGQWSDTYSVAAVMYYSITKKEPPSAIEKDYFYTITRTLSNYAKEYPHALIRIILDSLSNNFTIRTKSVSEILNIVSKYTSAKT